MWATALFCPVYCLPADFLVVLCLLDAVHNVARLCSLCLIVKRKTHNYLHLHRRWGCKPHQRRRNLYSSKCPHIFGLYYMCQILIYEPFAFKIAALWNRCANPSCASLHLSREAGVLPTTTISYPIFMCGRNCRNDSRINLLTRFLWTLFPTFLLTVIPNRRLFKCVCRTYITKHRFQYLPPFW